MRVIAGKARSVPLLSIEGKDTRPTTDRIKETLFNILSDDVPDCRFLDLFAGTGQIGIEAISRGAKTATFIEKDRRAVSCIRQNLEKTHFMEQATVLDRDVLSALSMPCETPFDILFLDPPYRAGIEDDVLRKLAENGYATVHSTVIVEAEMKRRFDFTDDFPFAVIREKNYKTNKHLFLKIKS